MRPAIPIEIVGGGLAGLSLGLALRRADVPVTVFEAGEYPRHRVCGEFIAGLDPGTIGKLGLAPLLADALQHHEVAWFVGEKATRVQRLPSPALALSRHLLDARLAENFVATGGELRTHTRATATNDSGRVLACGRRRGDSRWIGLKLHVRSLALARDLELHLGDQAYVGLTRVENDRVNVCGLFGRRQLSARGPNLLLAYLRAVGLSALAERLAAAEADPKSCCAVAAVTFDREVPTDESVRLGDACAMIPPFTGNGMAMAFQSAEYALDPIVAYSRGELTWTEARDLINRALRRRFRLRLASAAGLHSFLLRPSRQRWLALVNRAGLLPFRSLYAVLH